MNERLFELVAASLKDGGDWCTEQKALTLASMIVALRPKVVVEIGVWSGSSLIPMALAAKALGDWMDPMSRKPVSCRVVAIDPWDPVASAQNQLPINAEWWGKAPHEWAYTTFLERLEKFEVGGVVEVIRAKSDDALPPAGVGLLHCDGNHGEQAIADVHRFAPNVRVGGMVVLDDFYWEGGAVQRAGSELEGMGFRKLYEIDTVSYPMVFQRVGTR